MKFFSIFVSTTVALSVASTAWAAPSSVTALQAEFRKSGDIAVSWNKIENENIAYYRVYFSAKSILENEGIYDDFETTNGDRSLYVFDNLPPNSDVYVSVLAVDEDGEESEFFAEEILIHVPAKRNKRPEKPAETMVSELVKESPEKGHENGEDIAPLQLLGAEAVTATKVRVDLSHHIEIRSKGSSNLFSITRADGSELIIRTVVSLVDGTIIIRTDEQMSGTVYEVRINDVLGKSYAVVIDDGSRTTLFTGHADGKESVPPPTDMPEEEAMEDAEPEPAPSIGQQEFDPNMPPQPIEDLQLTYQQTSDGLYTVSATWKDAGVLKNALHLIVGQSFDGGKTYTEPQFMPGNALSANIQGISAGDFGLFIQSMDPFGRVSAGTTATIHLTGEEEEVMEDAEPVPEPEEELSVPEVEEEDVPIESSGTLPESGAGFLLLTLVFAGGLLGWRYQSGLLKMIPVLR